MKTFALIAFATLAPISGHAVHPVQLAPVPGMSVDLTASGQSLDLMAACPSGIIELRYHSSTDDLADYEACLDAAGRPLACVALPASKGLWQEVSIALPGIAGELAFPGTASITLWAQKIVLRSKAASAKGLVLAPPRLNASLPASPPASVAQAFGRSIEDVMAARALQVPEPLVWTLLAIQNACACSLSQLQEERSSMSWGEMAAAHHLDWEELNRDIWAKARQAGLQTPEPSPMQQERALSNHAFEAQR